MLRDLAQDIKKRPSTTGKLNKLRNDINLSNHILNSLSFTNIPPLKSEDYLSYVGNIIESSDFVITIEHCHECELHNSLSLRHDPNKYLNLANHYLRLISSLIHSFSLTVRLGVVRVPIISLEHVGAFEINVLYRNKEGILKVSCLHSKLKLLQWPSKSKVEDNLKIFLSDARLTVYESNYSTYSGTCTNNATFKPYPVGFGRWTETSIFNKDWSYIVPTFAGTKSSSSKLNTALNSNYIIEWVYDSRVMKVSYQYYIL